MKAKIGNLTTTLTTRVGFALGCVLVAYELTGCIEVIARVAELVYEAIHTVYVYGHCSLSPCSYMVQELSDIPWLQV